jgi:anaerobic selenocysteine-containing dehydrogenase
MSVSRRSFLRASAALAGGAGLAGVAGREAAAKIKPSLVDYQETPKDGRDCKGCKLFEPPNACKSVEGVISPSGWCKLWIKA